MSHEQQRMLILSQINNVDTAPVKKSQKHVLGPEDEFIEYVIVDGVRKKRVKQMIYQNQEITMQEVLEIKKAFDMFDKDQSNNIDV